MTAVGGDIVMFAAWWSMPAEGAGTWLLVLGLLQWVTAGGVFFNIQCMLPDSMDYDARRFGLRREGLFAGIFVMVEKFTSAVATALFGAFIGVMGYVAAGTSLQREKGIEDSPADHLADAYRINHGTGDRALLEFLAHNAAESVEWLLANGWRPRPEHPIITHGHEPYTKPRTYQSAEGGLAVLAALKRALEAAQAKHAVELRLNTRMTDLLTAADGSVTGVRATGPDGPLEVHADAVVLASGGYASNPSLWFELHGMPLRGWAWEHSQGDGLQAARRLGATVRGADDCLLTVGGVTNIDRPGVLWIATLLMPQARPPWKIFVNRAGDRFVAEDHPSVDWRERVLLQQPGAEFWVVYDEAMRERAPPLFFAWDAAKVERSFATHPDFQRAGSLAELASRCGVDPRRFALTVERYNAGQAAGSDAFGRRHLPLPIAKPPFYAVRHYGITCISFAGLHVDARLRVLGADGNPMPGLYAIGELLGLGHLGNAYLSGTGVGSAITYGLQLAKMLAG
jgi:fumarate reductase flavoprotein subunit